MTPLFRRAVRGVLLWAGLGLAIACPRPSAAPDGGGADGGGSEARAGARIGVEVPMPPGWTARIGADHSFQAGPPGTALMRIDRRPGAAQDLPSPARLRRGLEEGLAPATIAEAHEESQEGFSLLSFEVTLPSDSGTSETSQPGVLAAKAIGRDLYLCASLPGAGAADVHAVAKACRELTVRPSE